MTEKLTITRTWKPVTKTVAHCHECPWFHAEQDGNSTLPICENPAFNDGNSGHVNIIGDITMWQPHGISKHCPERVKTRKIFVGDNDHEPDKAWIQEIPITHL